MHRCDQCGTPLSPVDVMLGPVCGNCVRKNHAKVVKIVGGKDGEAQKDTRKR